MSVGKLVAGISALGLALFLYRENPNASLS